MVPYWRLSHPFTVAVEVMSSPAVHFSCWVLLRFQLSEIRDSGYHSEDSRARMGQGYPSHSVSALQSTCSLRYREGRSQTVSATPSSTDTAAVRPDVSERAAQMTTASIAECIRPAYGAVWETCVSRTAIMCLAVHNVVFRTSPELASRHQGFSLLGHARWMRIDQGFPSHPV